MRRPKLILQADQALIEIAAFRDATRGDYWQKAEEAWYLLNACRQKLICSLTLNEELVLEELKRKPE